MARIKLFIPDEFIFSTTIPVRITDLNYGGHVGNDTILTIIHEARMQFLNHFDYTEMSFEGVSLIMSDAAVEFKNEAFYGDSIEVFITITEFEKVSFDIFYKLQRTSDEKIIALAKTGMVCFNYDTRKIVAVPEKAKEILPG